MPKTSILIANWLYAWIAESVFVLYMQVSVKKYYIKLNNFDAKMIFLGGF